MNIFAISLDNCKKFVYNIDVRNVRNSLIGGNIMELAKVTSKGQITIPVAIRKLLGIQEGDKILFVEEGDKVVLMNASTNALMKAQKAFDGMAEELGIKDEQDVVDLVREIRAERRDKYTCE